MNDSEVLQREIENLRHRLSRLSRAGLRIAGDLDLDTVLQETVDGARSLTGARYGVLAVLDDGGEVETLLSSGLTPEEFRGLREIPGGEGLFEYLGSLPGPLRVADFAAHAAALGLPEFQPPVPVRALLAVPIHRLENGAGHIYVAHAEPGLEFSREDEDTLVMFASHAAMAVANARRYREERRARADLETLVRTSPVGVVVFDAATGTPAYLNREARRIVGGLLDPDQPPEDLLDALAFRRADGREISLREFPLAQALSAGETVMAEEIALHVPDGRRVNTLVNATPILTDGGEVESFIVILQDMTPIEDLQRQRAEFLGMVSHELRAPLAAIKGSAAAVMRAASTLDPAEIQQFFRIIDSQADHLLDLTGGLLDVARIDAGELSLTVEAVEVASLVDLARNTFLSGGGRDNLSIDLPPGLPRALADRRRIAQALGNLLSNAARHSAESSTIRVSAALEGVHVAFTVADDGVGIAPERLPRLFRRFYRSDNDEEAGGVGAGLGLAICKGIVEAHGGRIWAESDGLGMGARFTFTLPAAPETDTLLPRASGSTGRRGRQRVRVLAVDDDPQALRYLRDTLAEAGYAVFVAGKPEEALRLVQRERPHLVLLDLVLPGADGLELMQSILALANLPVIFLSGYGRDQVIARAFELGAEDYIVKPFSPTELVARIQAALRRRVAPERVEPPEPYALGDLVIDFAHRRVTVAGEEIQVTATEYDLLAELAVNAGRVVTHQELLYRVWGPTNPGSAHTIRTHLMRLRQKLGEDAENPTYIFSEPRVGYRMAAAAAARDSL